MSAEIEVDLLLMGQGRLIGVVELNRYIKGGRVRRQRSQDDENFSIKKKKLG